MEKENIGDFFMSLITFAVPFTEDERMIYTKEYLINKGYSVLDDCDQAEYIILPIPAKKEMFKNFEDKKVFYGCGDFKGCNYNENENFLLKNAFFTVEGAIALYKKSSDLALYGSKVLITGYGRIGKDLHRVLNSFGCKTTICSRSPVSKTIAKSNGGECIDLSDLSVKNDYDIIFNTIPKIIFSKNEIDALKKDAVFIELASFPGGIDMHYANARKLNIIDGRRLPSKYSKKSAGYLIGETVIEMIKEGLD